MVNGRPPTTIGPPTTALALLKGPRHNSSAITAGGADGAASDAVRSLPLTAHEDVHEREHGDTDGDADRQRNDSPTRRIPDCATAGED
jgi:hypothetical protein